MNFNVLYIKTSFSFKSIFQRLFDMLSYLITIYLKTILQYDFRQEICVCSSFKEMW